MTYEVILPLGDIPVGSILDDEQGAAVLRAYTRPHVKKLLEIVPIEAPRAIAKEESKIVAKAAMILPAKKNK